MSCTLKLEEEPRKKRTTQRYRGEADSFALQVHQSGVSWWCPDTHSHWLEHWHFHRIKCLPLTELWTCTMPPSWSNFWSSVSCWPWWSVLVYKLSDDFFPILHPQASVKNKQLTALAESLTISLEWTWPRHVHKRNSTCICQSWWSHHVLR